MERIQEQLESFGVDKNIAAIIIYDTIKILSISVFVALLRSQVLNLEDVFNEGWKFNLSFTLLGTFIFHMYVRKYLLPKTYPKMPELN